MNGQTRPSEGAPVTRSSLRWALYRRAAVLAAACVGALGGSTAALARTPATAPPSVEAQSRVLERATQAVIGVRARAVEGARSAATLGREREGSGVVLSDDGLVVTIGYLILEAEQVSLVLDDGRQMPARVVAYDVASGFGLVQSLVPLGIEPVALGRSGALSLDTPMMVVAGGDGGGVGISMLVSRRPFSGYWEYHVDSALFTAPPMREHSGAGLFNERGELVGIGSLRVADALGPERPRVPGNMFVPADLLAAILPDLKARGQSRLSERSWIGVNCVEQDGEVRVARVNDDSPADVAGLQRGDRILSIDGTPVASLEILWKTLWREAPPEREVTLEIMRSGERQTVKVFAVDRAKTLTRARGV